MQFKFIDKQIDYDGKQLRSHWIYEQLNILGNAIVCFIGKADVKIDNMVDLQDVKDDAFIYSEKMLHFIIEHFNFTLKETILSQRLFICIIQNTLNKILGGNCIERKGDDLFYNNKKLSVSIATISNVSGLIHVGINIESRNAPVNAAGLLSEININNINDLAMELLQSYTIEHEQIRHASYKVRSVI